ncbi:helix-hairpin-helix domain-containing protein [Nosocomiicoccus ampullae]|uniref:helix-hairpin-helix domain-containing protein n=1 Tax=Nosocomiicoccus ampullae TaxID=489910 RepID=UPI00254DB561|nr:helix-hairpin-helix domain-containing protein [Nosocomiicoccus ampullae]MDK6862573.1 helix-hairpin-helix domain-containing protein [Nosocomiicoccus ampullae]
MTELFFKYKTIISTAALGIIAVVMFILFFKTTDDFEYTTPVEVDNSVHAQVEEEVDTMSLNSIFVEIKGAVKHPNVYEMPKDARVKDIILLGEPLDSADLNQINQSEKLRDEMSIYVPAKGEIIETERETSSSHIVNINKASKDELMTLNGIGAKKAETIISYREENGLFEKKEDLMNIPGIGQKTFENLENDIEI